VILDRELDISRGDTLQSSGASEAAVTSTLRARVAWLDDEPLLPGRSYWALHGHRWVKAKVTRIINQTQISTLETHPATQLGPNAIGLIDLALQEPLPALSYRQSQAMGSLILVDTASHRTSGALMVESP
jgi:sulfate adenylyltransferase subunit 1